MGYPMAGHLARAGMHVSAYNRGEARREAWKKEFGGEVASSPAQATEGAELVMVCVSADRDVREVIAGSEGVLESCADPQRSSWITRPHRQSLRARWASVATKPAASSSTRPCPVDRWGPRPDNSHLWLGEGKLRLNVHAPCSKPMPNPSREWVIAGKGQLAKAVNQVCIAGILQGLSEGLMLAERAGLDIETLIESISKGAAGSWQMVNRSVTMAKGEFDFGFAVEHMRKDLGIALKTANELGAPLPMTALVDQFYADVEALGGKRYDTSSLIARLRALRP